MAVDYVKTGQPAHLNRDLKPRVWPHFMEKVRKKQHQIYTSKKVLGQLYDQVERVDFVPAFTAPFDLRILRAYTLDENILRSAREIKEEYDAHMRRIMAQQEINTEFEVWSTFVLQHSSTSNDFKYHEQIGEISMAIKDQFRLVCQKCAGGKDFEHMGPFAAAMYEVTAREVTEAVEECHRIQMVDGQSRSLREMRPSNMPLMSYPWLFPDVLGKIANSNTSEAVGTPFMRGDIDSKTAISPAETKAPQPKRGRVDSRTLDSGDYLRTSKGTTHPGELLELFGKSHESGERKGSAEAVNLSSSSISVKPSYSSPDTGAERGSSTNNRLIDHSYSSSPELLAWKYGKEPPKNTTLPVESDPDPTMGSVSHLHNSGGPMYSQGRTDLAGLAGEEQTEMLNKTSLARLSGDDEALSGEPNYAIPEGSNSRHLNGLMMGLSVRSDEPGDLLLRSSQNEGKNALVDLFLGEEKAGKRNQLSEADISDEAGKKTEIETIAYEGQNNHGANDKADLSSDSDAESDVVVLPRDVKATLLDQLRAITGEDSTLHASGIKDSPNAIQDSMDQKLVCSKSESMQESLVPGSESRERTS